jgi:hypothetical protein
MGEQISGWAKPEGGHCFHFFADLHYGVLLESVCSDYYAVPWFLDKTEPLDHSRALHQDGNCVGCRAWLSIPKNRQRLAAVEV